MANVHQHFGSHQDFSSHGHDFQRIQVFKVKTNCCEDCPKKLNEGLLKIHGIESVDVDARQNRVTVKGSVNSTEIINKIKNWGKKAELMEARETNPHGYRVELNDDDEDEKEDLLNTSCRHKDSSFRQKDSSFRVHNKDSSFRNKDSSFRGRDKNKGSSHAPEKYDYSERDASSPKDFPDHICRDKYCTIHKRDNSMFDRVPNTNYGASYPPSYRSGLNYNHPMMNSYASQYGQQYYGPRMMPPVPGYSGYATQRQMPMADGYADYFSDGHSNGCNIM